MFGPNCLHFFPSPFSISWRKINYFLTSVKEVAEPLKKIHESLSNDSNVVRPRERFLSERKVHWLEPQLTKLKNTHDELRKYRRQELSKQATLKMAKLKRNNRRQKRREWIQEQIKQGKLHKSALIWVNSNKLLPFEKTDKQTKSLIDDFNEVLEDESDIEMGVEETELNDAVKSIQKEPKDAKGKIKKSVVNESLKTCIFQP